MPRATRNNTCYEFLHTIYTRKWNMIKDYSIRQIANDDKMKYVVMFKDNIINTLEDHISNHSALTDHLNTVILNLFRISLDEFNLLKEWNEIYKYQLTSSYINGGTKHDTDLE